MVNGYAGLSEHRGTSPQPPFKGGKERSEAHEALTFGLLLGQAKSNGKRFFAYALNDRGR